MRFRVRNLILWAVIALGLMAMFTYAYQPRQVVRLPNHHALQRAPQDGHMFLLGYHA